MERPYISFLAEDSQSRLTDSIRHARPGRSEGGLTWLESHIYDIHHIRMIQAFQYPDLSQCSNRDSVHIIVHDDLLQSYHITGFHSTGAWHSLVIAPTTP
jgi:hypothetical protein